MYVERKKTFLWIPHASKRRLDNNWPPISCWVFWSFFSFLSFLHNARRGLMCRWFESLAKDLYLDLGLELVFP